MRPLVVVPQPLSATRRDVSTGFMLDDMSSTACTLAVGRLRKPSAISNRVVKLLTSSKYGLSLIAVSVGRELYVRD